MDKRRKAFGLKKRASGKNYQKEVEKQTTFTEKVKSPQQVDDESYNGGIKCVEHTPKQGRSMVDGQSPNSPLTSPGLKQRLPRVFCSPEIEVSWDWGCSQVPKDMVPVKRVQRARHMERSPSPLRGAIPSPRLRLTKHLSEEENQQRLAFYKNVLSQASKYSKEKSSLDSENNNLEEEGDPQLEIISENATTPSRRLKSSRESLSALFDDSANDLMFECSQAIEEQLKKGQINFMDSETSITSQKHALSSPEESDNVHKKLCFGKAKHKLFPDKPDSLDIIADTLLGGKRHLSLKSPRSRYVEDRTESNNHLLPIHSKNVETSDESKSHLFLKPKNETVNISESVEGYRSNGLNIPFNGKMSSTINDLTKLQVKDGNIDSPVLPFCTSVQEKRPVPTKPVQNNNGVVQKNSSNSMKGYSSYDSLDKFRKVPKSSLPPDSNSQLLQSSHQKMNASGMIRPPVGVKPIVHSSPLLAQMTTMSSSKSTQESQENDITSLLDDGFDSELSTLDFDSICNDSKAEKPAPVSITQRVQKTCSQQEIEAKRLAALKRLMMKKKT